MTDFPEMEVSRFAGFIGASGGNWLPLAKLKILLRPFQQDFATFWEREILKELVTNFLESEGRWVFDIGRCNIGN